MALEIFKKLKIYRLVLIQTLLLLCPMFLGCSVFDNGRINNIDISGYVWCMADSSAVPWALIHIGHSFTKSKYHCNSVYTDSLGYFEHFCTHPSSESSVGLEVMLTLMDNDQAENGIFLQRTF